MRTLSKDTVVIDCEIINAIIKPGQDKEPGITYCQGWDDHAGMGVSVTCAYDFATRRYHVFAADNRHELAALIDCRSHVVGFNMAAFDTPLLSTCWGIEIKADKRYDLLVEIWATMGLGPVHQSHGHNGYSLDACCQENLFGIRKTGDGSRAPIDWQRGRIGQVIDYCLNDVRMLALLMEIMAVRAANGALPFKSPKSGKWYDVRLPGESAREQEAAA